MRVTGAGLWSKNAAPDLVKVLEIVPWTVQRDRASRFPSPAAPSCWLRNAKSEEVLACLGDAAAQGRGKRDAPYRSPISSFLLHFLPSHCQFVAGSPLSAPALETFLGEDEH